MLLQTKELCKTYSTGLIRREKTEALRNASIHAAPGEAVGIFGKSGSGKTTLVNLIAGVLPPSSGEILWKERRIQYPYQGVLRRTIQVLYQHPEDAFDPTWPLKKSILEPFRIHHLSWSEQSLSALLESVGLYEEHLERKPSALSGGELQRAALARIMAMQPELVILDEPTSMLDSISQAQVLQILKEYQRVHQTAYLLISHNYDVIRHLCSRCYRIEEGQILGEETLHVTQNTAAL